MSCLQTTVDIEMHGLAYIEHSSSVPGSELAVSGRLELQQQSLLKAGTRRRVYNSPILFAVNTADPFQLVRTAVTHASHATTVRAVHDQVRNLFVKEAELRNG
jgi:hypothetical protein